MKKKKTLHKARRSAVIDIALHGKGVDNKSKESSYYNTVYSNLVTQPRWNPPGIGMNVTPGYPFLDLNKNPRSVKRQFWEISVGQSNNHFYKKN